mmetsp:Transcript_62287/g.129257  ORF Transcript_62287/g.129257 Transcript_62287/m.129257 type:complete len:283 (-) Transcript_62287:16-864(-)
MSVYGFDLLECGVQGTPRKSVGRSIKENIWQCSMLMVRVLACGLLQKTLKLRRLVPVQAHSMSIGTGLAQAPTMVQNELRPGRLEDSVVDERPCQETVLVEAVYGRASRGKVPQNRCSTGGSVVDGLCTSRGGACDEGHHPQDRGNGMRDWSCAAKRLIVRTDLCTVYVRHSFTNVCCGFDSIDDTSCFHNLLFFWVAAVKITAFVGLEIVHIIQLSPRSQASWKHLRTGGVSPKTSREHKATTQDADKASKDLHTEFWDAGGIRALLRKQLKLFRHGCTPN